MVWVPPEESFRRDQPDARNGNGRLLSALDRAKLLHAGSEAPEVKAVLTLASIEDAITIDLIIKEVFGRTKILKKHLRTEVRRAQAQSSLAIEKSTIPSRPPRPVIQVVDGELPATVDQAEDALIRADCGLYQRSGSVVRAVITKLPAADGGITSGHRIVPVTIPHIVECMTLAADFQKYIKSDETWKSTDCPEQTAQVYLARQQWRLPPLVGVISAPTLRHDGSILETPGYDDRTGLLFEPLGQVFYPVPQRPNRRDAVEALGQLHAIIDTFPFVARVDRSVAISAILTVLVRRSMASAPLHAFTAPVAGSGKTMLVNIAAIIASGRSAGVISQGHKEEEFEKRLASCLIAGDAIINIDNCEQPLTGDLLCQAISEPVVKPRVLGFSLTPDISSNGSIFATGNNLIISGDVSRRALLSSLDPQCERPELREFEDDPIATVISRRTDLVLAGLTILRAHFIAKTPPSIPALGGFEAWSRIVRDAIVWLGDPDPCITMIKIREADTKLSPLAAVLSQWLSVLGSSPVSARRIIELCAQPGGEDFREVITDIAGNATGISAGKLGKWLSKNQNRISDDISIVQSGVSHSAVLWTVKEGRILG